MKTKNMIWAALSMAAALVMTACTSEDNTVETPAAPQAEVKTIPYSVTVNGGAGTRATVDNDMKTLKFAEGDELHVIGTNISGTLTLKSSDAGKSSGATFEGDLNYTGDAPASDLSLTAVLVGTNAKGVNVDATAISFSYPNNAYCADVNEAVEEYSVLMGKSTYGAKSFTLTQKTAFLNFEITFEDGTAENATLSTVVSNGGSALCTANVKTKKDGEKVVAKFVLPVMSTGTTLSSATVKLGDKEAISFGASQELEGKVYNVKKTQAATPVTAITLNKTETSIEVGSTETLSVTAVAPDNATDKTYTWKTNDASIATVDQDGKVTAVAAGTVTIYAEANDGSDVKGNCTVTVSKKAGSISYTTTKISKLVGDAAFTNELTKVGDGSVSYASDNTAVATVATDGTVTIKGAGTANITATVADSDTYTYATTTASYELTVSQVVDKLDPFGNGGNPLNP
jgi:uncharacterized protein YjdB